MDECFELTVSPRSVRRHHIDRLKSSRRYFWGRQRDLSQDPRALGLVLSTPNPCSCYMCGNPRRYFKSDALDEVSSLEMLKLELLSED